MILYFLEDQDTLRIWQKPRHFPPRNAHTHMWWPWEHMAPNSFQTTAAWSRADGQSWLLSPVSMAVLTAKPHFPWGCSEPITNHASAFLPNTRCLQLQLLLGDSPCPLPQPLSLAETFLETVPQFETFKGILPFLSPFAYERSAFWSPPTYSCSLSFILHRHFPINWFCQILSYACFLGTWNDTHKHANVIHLFRGLIGPYCPFVDPLECKNTRLRASADGTMQVKWKINAKSISALFCSYKNLANELKNIYNPKVKQRTILKYWLNYEKLLFFLTI